MRWLRMIAVVSVLAAGLLWFVPYTPLRDVEVFAMLVAPDAVHATLLGALALTLFAVSAWKRRARALIVAVLAFAVGGLYVGRILYQGVAITPPEPAKSSNGVTVLSWNAAGAAAGEAVGNMARYIEQRGVDVVVLPESAPGEILSPLLDEIGWKHTALLAEGMSVFVSEELDHKAEYKIVEGYPPWAGVQLQPRHPSKETPILLAVHVQQPSPGNLGVRKQHTDWVSDVCAKNEYVLAVGDFNTTLNHLSGAAFTGCKDIAAAQGSGAAATWPTWLPVWMGVSIDRAMVSAPFAPEDSTFEVLRDFYDGPDGAISGVDHWPILVTVS